MRVQWWYILEENRYYLRCVVSFSADYAIPSGAFAGVKEKDMLDLTALLIIEGFCRDLNCRKTIKRTW